MKMVFLFDKEVLPDFKKDRAFDEVSMPEFFSWKYGPFSKDLLNDLEFLINQGYIRAVSSQTYPTTPEVAEYEFWISDFENFQAQEYDEETFDLTTLKGIPKARMLWDSLSKNQQEQLSEFKAVLNKASLDRILEYVYKKYRTDYTDKSLIREKYLL